MTDEMRREILDEVVAYSTVPTLGPAQFTVRDYAEKSNLNVDMSRNRLAKMVAEGYLLQSRAYDERVGRVVNAYRKA